MSEQNSNQTCIYITLQMSSADQLSMFERVVKPTLVSLNYECLLFEIALSRNYEALEIIAYLSNQDIIVIDFTYYSPVLSFLAGACYANGKSLIAISQGVVSDLNKPPHLSILLCDVNDVLGVSQFQQRIIEAVQNSGVQKSENRNVLIENLAEIARLQKRLVEIEAERAQLLNEYRTYREPEALNSLVGLHSEMERVKSSLNNLQNDKV